MRKMLLALAVLSLATLPAFAQAPAVDADAAAVVTAPDAAQDVTPAETPSTLTATPAPEPVSGYNYPRCYQVAGNACTEGQTAWCQWTPYEPELCWCNEGTFQCGSLH